MCIIRVESRGVEFSQAFFGTIHMAKVQVRVPSLLCRFGSVLIVRRRVCAAVTVGTVHAVHLASVAEMANLGQRLIPRADAELQSGGFYMLVAHGSGK
jgi:hypothetical protein